MSPEFHGCGFERGEARPVRIFRQTRSQRTLLLSLASFAWPLVFSIGLVGFSASPAAWAAGPTRRAAASTPNAAARSNLRGTRTAPQSASPLIDPRVSAKLPLPAPSPPPAVDRSSTTIDPTPPATADESDADAEAPLPSELVALQAKIRRVLAIYFPKHQNTRDNNAWEVMHEIIAFGVDSQLYRGGPQGPKVNAISWLCYNGSCKGEQMLYLDRGNLVARKGPGVQGHFGQFLAILAQSRLPIDYPMLVHGKNFTIGDLVECEKTDCQPGEELTFKLIGLMHYLDSDATWTNRYGDEWSIPRLISEELKQPIRGAACGGTHRLMGFSYAVNKRVQRGKPLTGEFVRAQKFIRDYHRYTFSLQNPDGSFSTQWFTRREADTDVDRRLKTTGHVAEWLAFSLSDKEIRDPRVSKAIDYLASILLADQNRTWEIGPVGHGLHALAVYNARLSAPRQSTQSSVVRLPEALPVDDASLLIFPLGAAPATYPQAGSATNSGATSDEDRRASCPGKALYEVAKRLEWGMLPCEIGNESSEPALVAPDAAIAPGDDDDEMCL